MLSAEISDVNAKLTHATRFSKAEVRQQSRAHMHSPQGFQITVSSRVHFLWKTSYSFTTCKHILKPFTGVWLSALLNEH